MPDDLPTSRLALQQTRCTHCLGEASLLSCRQDGQDLRAIANQRLSAPSQRVRPVRQPTPEVQELSDLLIGLSGLGFRDHGPASRHISRATPDRAALETYIAGRFGPMVTDPRFWSDRLTAGFLGGIAGGLSAS